MTPFREKYLLDFLTHWNNRHPLDMALHHYFKEKHSLGSHDRKAIREQVYILVRNQRLIDYPKEQLSWQERLKRLSTFDQNVDVPNAVKVSMPDFLYQEFVNSWGEKQAYEIAEASNTIAPITVRANTLKISRDDLLKELQANYRVIPTEQSPVGITFLEPVRFESIPSYKLGQFEVQDEGSQLVSLSVKVKPKQLFLDYCAGSGGKSLAIAPQMDGKGSLFLHDIRDSVLIEAKKRLKRAGIQNVQILSSDHATLKSLKHKVDWVLIDVPCSGTGTLRRSPDMKWRLTENDLVHLVETQKEIFKETLPFVKDGGKITYATCSVLTKENQDQVDYFLGKYPVKLVEEPLKTYPVVGGMDGFFAATFSK